MEQGPSVETIEEADKEARREARQDRELPTEFTDRDGADLAALQAAPEAPDPQIDTSARPEIAVSADAISNEGLLENRAKDAAQVRERLDQIAEESPADLPAANLRAVDSLHAASAEDATVRQASRIDKLQNMADNGALVASAEELDKHDARQRNDVPLPPKESGFAQMVAALKGLNPFDRKPTDSKPNGGEK